MGQPPMAQAVQARHAVRMVSGKTPTLIVLAAGRGTRFGASHHKLLQPLGAATVLSTTLAHAVASGLPLVVVTTPALYDVACQSVAARDVITLATSDLGPGFGMGRSLAKGVLARPDAAGWLVLPGDMPLVRSLTLRAVAQGLRHHTVVYAQHQGRRGHPVGFAAELYSELAHLTGDEGARRVVARYPAMGVDVDDPGALLDIDTPDDLHLAQAYHAADRAMDAGAGKAESS
jgi:molybdenum cofactor cytidylyltransferase